MNQETIKHAYDNIFNGKILNPSASIVIRMMHARYSDDQIIRQLIDHGGDQFKTLHDVLVHMPPKPIIIEREDIGLDIYALWVKKAIIKKSAGSWFEKIVLIWTFTKNLLSND